MATLHTLISLDHLHCNKESDEPGEDEPYLWTAFFKIDGDTVVLDLIGEGSDESLNVTDCYLRGTCTFVATPGSHGNLGTADVEAGDDVPIPSAVGEVGFMLTPIPVTLRAQTKLGREFVDGGVGGVVALTEENSNSDAGAEAGHGAFNRTLENGINAFLFQEGGSMRREDLAGNILGVGLQKPSPEQIEALKAKVAAAAGHIIIEVDGIQLDHDLLTGAKHRFTTPDDLRGSLQEIHERFQRIETDVHGNSHVAADYELFGDILGIEPSPLGHAVLRRSHEYGTPAAAGAPTSYVHPGLGVQNIVYRDTDGRLHELWRDTSGRTGTTNLTAAANAPTATGNPSAYIDTNTVQQIVVYRGTDNHVHSLYWSTGRVGRDNLTGAVGAPKADSNPVGYFTPATNTNHVIYRTRDGHLHVLSWAGADDRVHHEDMTEWAGAPPAVGDPAAYVDTTHGENVIVYRGADGHIYDIHWRADTRFQYEDLSGVAGTPPAEGDPVAYYIAGADMNQVTYRSGAGLFELSWVGNAAVSGWDLTAASGAFRALSDPAVYYSAGTNTKHVIYRAGNDHLYEIWWVPGSGASPAVVDLTLMGLARRAIDKPAAFTVEGPNTQHVIYRSADNEIREIRSNLEALQVAGTTLDGGVWHTIRRPDGWYGFGDVKGEAGRIPNSFTAVACAGIGQLHVCGTTVDGGMWHTIRRPDGWYQFGDVKGVAGSYPGSFTAVGCAGVNGELHVCGITVGGGMWHTIRRADGGWYGFGDVKGVAGSYPGSFTAVGCAGVNGELHVCGITVDGGMWHTIRRADGGWYGFGDVKGVAGSYPGSFTAVGCAGVNGELHVCGITVGGGMWHTIRRADGGWYGFGDVKGVAGSYPGSFTAVGCAGVNGELHVCGITLDGGIWHTIRRADWGWYGFGDVKGQAGQHPGSFTTVGGAGVG